MKLEPVELVQSESKIRGAQSVLIGALYGFLIGISFVGSATIVDRLLHPDLPLGIDLSLLAVRGGWIVLGLVLIGAITSLFNETLPGLFAGAVIAGLVALVSALLSSEITVGLKVIVVIFALIPISVMALPVTWILRWLVDRHEQALESKRITQIISLVLLAIVLGAGSGFFLRMSKRALQASRFMNHLLQIASQDEDSPIQDLPGFPDHASMRYQLFQEASESSTEGFDVRAEYADGYSINCTIVIYPGSEPFAKDCTSLQK